MTSLVPCSISDFLEIVVILSFIAGDVVSSGYDCFLKACEWSARGRCKSREGSMAIGNRSLPTISR